MDRVETLERFRPPTARATDPNPRAVLAEFVTGAGCEPCVSVDLAFDEQLPEVFARTGYEGAFHMVGQWFPKIGVRVGAPGALGMSLRTAALAIGGDEELALLREAVAVLEHSPARLELAHALADLGAELSRCGRRTEGRDAQRRAISLAGQCGAVALAERAMAGLHAGPGRRARIELTGPSALTAAERRVCRQVAGGQTNREVAQALFVTEKTVERHLSSAYQKLGIRSRFQLASAIGG